jgi:glycosyltransferase involved in cell wall biosynthesis
MIAIITVTKDDINGLTKTLESSRYLRTPVRWVVIDGSKDMRNRVAAESLAKSLSVEYRHQEPRGIYHAMNSGLTELSDDDYCLFLNGGDVLTDHEALLEVQDRHQRISPSWFVFATEFVIDETNFVRNNKKVTFEGLLQGKVSVCHQSVIANVGLLRELAGFDETLNLAADYKILLGLAEKVAPEVSRRILSTVTLGGVSDVGCRRLAVEKYRVRREFGHSAKAPLILAIESARCVLKLLIRKAGRVIGFDPNRIQRRYHRAQD